MSDDRRVRVWAIASREFGETLDLFASKWEAEEALAEILADEPSWRELLYVTAIEFSLPLSGPALN